MIVLGLIISIVGILQAMNDVVKVSDHVMYGEHESIAFGLIFLGIIIIILAFYKELMKLVGLNNLTNVTIVNYNDGKNRKITGNDKYLFILLNNKIIKLKIIHLIHHIKNV